MTMELLLIYDLYRPVTLSWQPMRLVEPNYIKISINSKFYTLVDYQLYEVGIAQRNLLNQVIIHRLSNQIIASVAVVLAYVRL